MTEASAVTWIELSLPLHPRSNAHKSFRRLASSLRNAARADSLQRAMRIDAAVQRATQTKGVATHHRPTMDAACLVLGDLARQGWDVSVARGCVRVRPPEVAADRETERVRVRAQELVKRDQQLRAPAVARFIRAMERRRVHA